MHKNRKLFNLEQYQTILTNREKSFKLLLSNTQDNSLLIYSPKFKSNWLPGQRLNKFLDIRRRVKPVTDSERFDFLTLTYSNRRNSNAMIYEKHKADINLFFKTLRKKEKNFKYFYVVELTNQLTPHFHVFISPVFSKTFLKKTWFQITGNFETKVEEIAGKKALTYCFKYLVKQFSQSDIEAKKLEYVYKNISRLLGFSRNFFSAQIKEPVLKLWQLIAYLTCKDACIHEHLTRLNAQEHQVFLLQVINMLGDDPPTKYLNNFPVYTLD